MNYREIAKSVANAGAQNALLRQEPGYVDLFEKALRELHVAALKEAAEEAGKERIMFLTHESVGDGILNDDHPVIVARRVMRQEIVRALLDKAFAIELGAKSS